MFVFCSLSMMVFREEGLVETVTNLTRERERIGGFVELSDATREKKVTVGEKKNCHILFSRRAIGYIDRIPLNFDETVTTLFVFLVPSI